MPSSTLTELPSVSDMEAWLTHGTPEPTQAPNQQAGAGLPSAEDMEKWLTHDSEQTEEGKARNAQTTPETDKDLAEKLAAARRDMERQPGGQSKTVARTNLRELEREAKTEILTQNAPATPEQSSTSEVQQPTAAQQDLATLEQEIVKDQETLEETTPTPSLTRRLARQLTNLVLKPNQQPSNTNALPRMQEWTPEHAARTQQAQSKMLIRILEKAGAVNLGGVMRITETNTFSPPNPEAISAAKQQERAAAKEAPATTAPARR